MLVSSVDAHISTSGSVSGCAKILSLSGVDKLVSSLVSNLSRKGSLANDIVSKIACAERAA